MSTRTLAVCGIPLLLLQKKSLLLIMSLVLGYDPLLSPQYVQSEIPAVSHPLYTPLTHCTQVSCERGMVSEYNADSQ